VEAMRGKLEHATNAVEQSNAKIKQLENQLRESNKMVSSNMM
jgi:hypothetical protein